MSVAYHCANFNDRESICEFGLDSSRSTVVKNKTRVYLFTDIQEAKCFRDIYEETDERIDIWQVYLDGLNVMKDLDPPILLQTVSSAVYTQTSIPKDRLKLLER